MSQSRGPKDQLDESFVDAVKEGGPGLAPETVEKAARFIKDLVNPEHPTGEARCPGCGKTPCPLDSRGMCPNRPDEPAYMDDSWGDYEPYDER